MPLGAGKKRHGRQWSIGKPVGDITGQVALLPPHKQHLDQACTEAEPGGFP